MLAIFRRFRPGFVRLVSRRRGEIASFVSDRTRDGAGGLTGSSTFTFFPGCSLIDEMDNGTNGDMSPLGGTLGCC